MIKSLEGAGAGITCGEVEGSAATILKLGLNMKGTFCPQRKLLGRMMGELYYTETSFPLSLEHLYAAQTSTAKANYVILDLPRIS